LLTIAHERFCRAADAGLGLRDDSRECPNFCVRSG